MTKRKMLIVANCAKIHINVFHLPVIQMMKSKGWQVDVICIHDADVPYCDQQYDAIYQRNPISLATVKGIAQVRKLVKANHYDIVHSHTPVGGVVARLACLGVENGPQVIYTAHGFHFYKGAPLKNWLIYFPVEWMCAHFTHILVTINKEDYNFAKKRMRAEEIAFIPGVGVDANKIQAESLLNKKKRSQLRESIGCMENDILLLSVGELNVNKNHSNMIKALAKLNRRTIHYVIVGEGERKKDLLELANTLGISDNVHLLGFKSNVMEWYKAADIFAFPSFREGLSMSLMEAMANGLPCVVSEIRGNVDLIDERGGCVFDPHDVNDIVKAINKIMERDIELMGEYNEQKVLKYDLHEILKKYSLLYDNAIIKQEI